MSLPRRRHLGTRVGTCSRKRKKRIARLVLRPIPILPFLFLVSHTFIASEGEDGEQCNWWEAQFCAMEVSGSEPRTCRGPSQALLTFIFGHVNLSCLLVNLSLAACCAVYVYANSNLKMLHFLPTVIPWHSIQFHSGYWRTNCEMFYMNERYSNELWNVLTCVIIGPFIRLGWISWRILTFDK